MSKKLQFTLLLSMIVLLTSFTNKTNNIKKNSAISAAKSFNVSRINAAVIHPNGKAYFFIKNYYRRFNIQTNRFEKVGRINKDGWKGVPNNVDAVFIHPQNKKGYFFVGNLYYRYDFKKDKVDKKGIIGVDGWKGVDGPIDAVVMHPTNNSVYFFKGNKYYRYSLTKHKMDKIGTIGSDGWKGVPTKLDAALMHTNGKAYFFKGDHYYRFNFNKHRVEKKAIIGRDGWRGLFPRLNATVFNIEHNNMHVFKGSTLTSIHNEVYNANSPDIITVWARLFHGLDDYRLDKNTYHKYKLGYDSYRGIPANVDAALRHGINKKYYFFKGTKYYRWNPKTKKVDKIAIIGKDGWKGVPTNLDAATGVSGGAYFFKNTKYYQYSFSENKVIATGEISSKFKRMPNYIDAATSYHKKALRYSGGTYVKGGDESAIIFFKNNISYYHINERTTRWETIHKELFK